MAKQTAKQTATAPAQESAGISMTKAQQKAVTGMTTVSARIRYLTAEGYSRSDITKLIPNAKGEKLLYQHVRNVLETKAPAKS